MNKYVYVVKYCEKCGYAGGGHPEHTDSVCKRCNIKLKVLPEEIKNKYHIYNGEDWINLVHNHDDEMLIRLENFAMGELKDNPIFSIDAYNEQMQEEKLWLKKRREEDKNRANYTPNIPKCPICGSTKLDKISFGTRAIKTAFFGIAGAVDDSGKTYKCKNCGSKF